MASAFVVVIDSLGLLFEADEHVESIDQCGAMPEKTPG
jgi:hypothetical protein